MTRLSPIHPQMQYIGLMMVAATWAISRRCIRLFDSISSCGQCAENAHEVKRVQWGTNLLHKSRIRSVPLSKPIDSPALLFSYFMYNIARYVCHTSGLHDRNRISLLWVRPSTNHLLLGLHHCVLSALDLLQKSFPASSIRFITPSESVLVSTRTAH